MEYDQDQEADQGKLEDYAKRLSGT